MENWDKPFWRSVLSESDGSGSSVRLCITIVVFCACIWITYLTFIHKQFPEFLGVGGFVGGVASALYTINQAANYLKDKNQPPTGGQ